MKLAKSTDKRVECEPWEVLRNGESVLNDSLTAEHHLNVVWQAFQRQLLKLQVFERLRQRKEALQVVVFRKRKLRICNNSKNDVSNFRLASIQWC